MRCLSILLLCGAALCTSCGSAMKARDCYIVQYQQGNLPAAEAILSQTIAEEIPARCDTSCDDATWLLLDRATINFAKNNIECAIDDYRRAVDLLDHYSQDCIMESVGKVLLQDEMGAYPGEDYEQVLARIYFALVLLHKGDNNNAYALLRQAEELQQKKRGEYATSPCLNHYNLIDNPLGKYLFATLLDKRGDKGNAEILYKQAAALSCQSSTIPTSACSAKDEATVVILCHNGNIPKKISTVTDASRASTIALEIFMGVQCVDPAWMCLTGIPTPAFQKGVLSEPSLCYSQLDSVQKPLLPIFNVDATARYQLEEKMPVIVARGVARYLLRRGAVACAQDQDPNLGALVDFALLIANTQTKADTRSWGTLPSSLDIARYEAAEGCHTLTVQVCPYGLPPYQKTYQLNLKAGDLCVVNIFNIHPGVTSILIPERFLSN